LARIDNLNISNKKKAVAQAVGFVAGGYEIFVDLAGVVDFSKEKERIQKEIDAVAPYVGSVEKKLSNKEFVKNAPKEVVEGEKKKLEEAKEKLEKLNQQLNNLKS